MSVAFTDSQPLTYNTHKKGKRFDCMDPEKLGQAPEISNVSKLDCDTRVNALFE